MLDNNAVMMNFNKDLMLDFNWFLRKINERACIQNGFIDIKYEPVNRHGDYDPGLGLNVEYFHPSITLDDRMRHIGTVIASQDCSVENIICNTLISHFYGARGVHRVISGGEEIVDFERIKNNDIDYIHFLKYNADMAKSKKVPIWGTTELHTSIQTGAKRYCAEKYGDKDRKFHTIDVCEWVASFIDNGLIDKLKKAVHIKEAYTALKTQFGIGEYYAFHGAASTSVLKQLKYHHDQRFVSPGPGARYTISLLWPELKSSLYPDSIYFLRENGDEVGLTKDVLFHPLSWNINLPNGDCLFEHQQDGLKYYGTEVLCCQFGVYLQIRNDKNACERRKVSRTDEFVQTDPICGLEDFMT